ncbi:hypothetical protein IT072_03665 [Leifsonia sp. ZF2019]|uniref:hypothetical protein n=1 Tax=Leifsonia sp. ZF2019 TaxID=2781978 RepID=UPI001CBDAFDE|nr:hypothetical protein [Leifsonia sp. ZF2019]UAJ80156.1 hypothetical protein IT072_03665 [Leifsonia sp. ZF2019]
MARIKHPRPQLGRIRDRIAGVEFIDGYADIDLSDKPNLADAYAMHGYEVEPEVAETATISDTAVSEHEGDESLDSLTIPELKALADESGIETKSKWSKADYLEALANHLENVIGTASAELRKAGVEESEVPAASARAEALATAGLAED